MGNDKRYKQLDIDLNLMEGWIQAYCSQNGYSGVVISEDGNNQVKNYKVQHSDGSFEISLFVSAGNRFTIKHKYDADQKDSIAFADYIVERLGSANKPIDSNKGYTLRIGEEDFNSFIELLKETNDDLDENCIKKQNEVKYKFKSRLYKDEITVHYYISTHNVFIQGKRLQLFNKATDILSGKCELVDVVNAEIRYDSIDTTCETVLEQMQASLGKVYNYLTHTQIAIMSNSFKFYRVEMQSLDYSCLVQPMCRAMEGFIFRLFEEFEDKGINTEEVDGVGYFFHGEDHKTNPLKMKQQFSEKIDNLTVENKLNRIYNWYYKNRHQYSHSGPYDDTTAIITDRKVADALFLESVELYKDTYDIVMKEIGKE